MLYTVIKTGNINTKIEIDGRHASYTQLVRILAEASKSHGESFLDVRGIDNAGELMIRDSRKFQGTLTHEYDEGILFHVDTTNGIRFAQLVGDGVGADGEEYADYELLFDLVPSADIKRIEVIPALEYRCDGCVMSLPDGLTRISGAGISIPQVECSNCGTKPATVAVCEE